MKIQYQICWECRNIVSRSFDKDNHSKDCGYLKLKLKDLTMAEMRKIYNNGNPLTFKKYNTPYEIKNQNFVKEGIKNDCIIYSESTIFELQYGVLLTYKMVEGLVTNALVNKVISLLGGVFNILYPWTARIIGKAIGLNIEVEKTYITSKSFENGINKGKYYGIGLLKANSTYIKAIENGKLTRKDIINISNSSKVVGHNHVVGRSLDGYGISVFEVARGVEVKISLDTLKYGVELGVFYLPARTFVGADSYSRMVLDYLRQINHKRLIIKPVFTRAIGIEEREALNHANELNKKYFIKTSGIGSQNSND